MRQPSRSELGDQISVIRRPLNTMRGWFLLIGVVILLIYLSPHSSVGETFSASVSGAIVLVVIRHIGAVRVFELGLESNGTRMLWDKLVAYRLSWAPGSQKIALVEQATARELLMYLVVFQSNTFRDAVGDRANLGTLVKVGLP